MKPIKTGKLKVVNAQTGEVLEEKANAFILLPPPPGVCQECATEHEYFQPHNQQSLYYQTAFHAQHGRWPNWTDAMAHCPEEVRQQWRAALVTRMKEHGLEIPADLQEEGEQP